MTYALRLRFFLLLVSLSVGAQQPAQPVVKSSPLPQRELRQLPLRGYFLTDSIEIGRPFQYSLTYRHAPTIDVLFPDTSRHFAPYRVEKVAVFATETTGIGSAASSRDSAVYTLVSFDTKPFQLLTVPVRIINEADCTAQWSQIDTVFLRSKLALAKRGSSRSVIPKLATETSLATLQQQFNYLALAFGFLSVAVVAFLLYGLFGRTIRRQWRLYKLKRQHLSFQNDYNRLTRTINSYTAADIANQAVISWKSYLEQLDKQPYTSLTTPELAARMNDERIANALREADLMIYRATYSPESLPALRLLGEVATNAYHRRRASMQEIEDPITSSISQEAESTSIP
ncbi:hypothetical protein GO730_25830 [Spirosoma sp. HMF3257]|uniref:Protein BatD n=1 Tax=Spirosoma telluris TaxID=2183553 RepID=A0A327NQL7_9BACT|nr:hypothetical protein [Spirosoma telluris]RAI76729.1 hypothetical protein HMF3257_25775 [Spirosoma telluris]